MADGLVEASAPLLKVSAMSKAVRLARLDDRRVELEREYLDALIAALRSTASGEWGPFGHNGDQWTGRATASVLDNLHDLGDALNGARDRLGLPEYELHREFLASRGSVGPQAVGEPKQAQAWLDQLEATMQPTSPR